jgi:hypothetical protein
MRKHGADQSSFQPLPPASRRPKFVARFAGQSARVEFVGMPLDKRRNAGNIAAGSSRFSFFVAIKQCVQKCMQYFFLDTRSVSVIYAAHEPGV